MAERVLIGTYTTAQADGAIPNGTRIVKRNSEGGDSRANGELGTVIGSWGGPEVEAVRVPGRPGFSAKHVYCIEWDSLPGVVVLTIDDKVARGN